MLKDKKITILGRVLVENELGETTYIDGPISNGSNIWAYYRHSTAREQEQSIATNTKVDVVFVINWRDDIDETMKIEYKGDKYEITRIDDFEGYKEDLTIYAYKVK